MVEAYVNECPKARDVPATAAGGGIDAAPRGTPSVFERLICLGSLVKHGAGVGRAAEPAESKPLQMLRNEHQTVFEHWLRLQLRNKMADLEACGESQGRTANEVMRDWIQPRWNLNLIPAAAARPQRELFQLGLEILWPIMAAAAFPENSRDALGPVLCDSTHLPHPIPQVRASVIDHV